MIGYFFKVTDWMNLTIRRTLPGDRRLQMKE